MTHVAPHISAFLRERLPVQRAASPHTCDAYAYAFMLFFEYASDKLSVAPSELQVEQLDAPMVLEFLDHLESARGNSPSTRNARLAAIKSFFRFIEHRVPSILEHSRRVLAIPSKRSDTKLVQHLSPQEMQAILRAPDVSTRTGLRDRAMLNLGSAAGLRVSELVGLRRSDMALRPRPEIRVQGKGRKERCLPLWKQTAGDLRAWLEVRGELPGVDVVFLNARGGPMTRSGFAYLLDKHVQTATAACSSLRDKKVSPHVLRHTCAMTILRATGDLRKVSLWLGHTDMQTTQIYLRADPTEKLEAIETVLPPELRPGTYRPPDRLIALLRGR